MLRRPLRTPLLLAGILAAALRPAEAAAQRAAGEARAPAPYRSRIDTTFAFARGGTVDLAQLSGDVVVTAWNRSEIRIRAHTELGRLDPTFSASRVALRVEGEGGDRRRGRVGDSRIEVTVPAGARVRAASTSGDVTIGGTRGEVDVSTTSGDVAVREAGGLTTVSSFQGDVVIAGVDGDVSVSTVSGDLDVRDVRGDLRAGTTSGDMELRAIGGRAVVAKTTNGEIDFTGPLASGGRYEFVSHSGDVVLRLAEGTGAELFVQTFSGSLDTDFPVTLGARRVGRPSTLELTLGDGGPRVRAETFSGDVVLQRLRASPRERR